MRMRKMMMTTTVVVVAVGANEDGWRKSSSLILSVLWTLHLSFTKGLKGSPLLFLSSEAWTIQNNHKPMGDTVLFVFRTNTNAK